MRLGVSRFACIFLLRELNHCFKCLPKIMYNIFTSEPFRALKNTGSGSLFINFEKVDLKKALQQKILQITFVFSTVRFPRNSKRISNLHQLFDTIQCSATKHKHIKVNPCSIGSSKYKLFYQNARDLYDYIVKLNNKVIPRSHHNHIFTIISSWDHFKNHNLDVPLLHFK